MIKVLKKRQARLTTNDKRRQNEAQIKEQTEKDTNKSQAEC